MRQLRARLSLKKLKKLRQRKLLSKMAVKYIANILGTAVFATVLLIVAVPLKNSAKYFGEQTLLKFRRVWREAITVNVMNSNSCFEEKVGE